MPATKLDDFTIMFAQVNLAFNDKLTSEKGPFVRDSSGKPLTGTNAKNAELHYSFKMTPLTTSNAEESIFYDMLFFPSETMQFDLYARVTDSSGADKTREVFPKMEDGKDTTLDSNHWVYIGNSGRAEKGSSANLYGNAFYNYDAGKLPILKTLDQDYTYEFVATVTYMQETNDPGAWTGTVDMDIKIAAGYQNNISGLKGGITTARWEQFLKDGMTRGGKNVGNPDDFALPHTFYDYTVPQFSNLFPEFCPEADKVTINVRTTPPGQLYYVIAPVDVARDKDGNIIQEGQTGYRYSPAIGTTWDNSTGTGHTHGNGGQTIPLAQIPKSITKDTNGKVIVNEVGPQPGTAKNDPIDATNGHLLEPSNGKIQEPAKYFDPNEVKWNEAPITTTNNSMPILVEGLAPQTLYFAYFVMKSNTGQQLSKVWVYQFETTPVTNPQIIVGRDSTNATFQIDNNVPSYLDYIVYTTQFLPKLFTKKMSDSGAAGENVVGAYMRDDVSAGDKKDYGGLTLVQAMTRRYTGDEENYRNFSVFDALASDATKREVAAIIRQTSLDYNTLGRPTDSGKAVDMTEVTRKTQPINNMGDDAQHYVLVVGHHEAVEKMGDYKVEEYDSFGAIDNVAKPVTKVPKYTGPTGERAFTATKETADGWEGDLTLRFDGPLHQVVIEASTDQPNGVQKTYKINSSPAASQQSDTRSITEIISKPSGVTLTVNGTSLAAATTFVIHYTGIKNGAVLFLPDDGKIANSAGTTREEQLMLQFYEKIELEQDVNPNPNPDPDNDSGLIIERPVKKGYWTVTWG